MSSAPWKRGAVGSIPASSTNLKGVNMKDKIYIEFGNGDGSKMRIECDHIDVDTNEIRDWFRTIMFFMIFSKESIDEVLPDCEECIAREFESVDETLESLGPEPMDEDLSYIVRELG